MLTEKFKEFSNIYKEDMNKNFSNELPSFQILVKEVPNEIRDIIGNSTLKVEGSIGRGNFAYYPWIAIFDTRITEKATEGFYVVLLFRVLRPIFWTQNSRFLVNNSHLVMNLKPFCFKFCGGKIP